MIHVETGAAKLMYEDAKSRYPHECCGFLYGNSDKESKFVSFSQPVPNAAAENRERKFVISPKDYMKAEAHALDNDIELLGIYHSHPNHPAVPSEHDRVAAQPSFSYVIVSVAADGIKDSRSWVLNSENQFEEEIYSEFSTQKL